MATYQAAPMAPNKSQSDVVGTPLDSAKIEDYSAEKCILYMDEHYILVNKPPNVRMDGDFDVTLQKLLLAWIPDADLSTIKWVHQLDYATSGIICIARTKPAAGLAVAAFQKRETTKQYLAVVEGHLDTSRWPVRSRSDILAPAPAPASAPTLTTVAHGTLRKPDGESMPAAADAGQPHKLRRKSEGEGETAAGTAAGTTAGTHHNERVQPPPPAQTSLSEAADAAAQGGGKWQDIAMRETLDVHFAALQSLITAHVTHATATAAAAAAAATAIDDCVEVEVETGAAIAAAARVDSEQTSTLLPPPPPQHRVADTLQPFLTVTYDELLGDSRKRKALRKALARCGVPCGFEGQASSSENRTGAANSGKGAKKRAVAVAVAVAAAVDGVGGAGADAAFLSVHDGGETGVFREMKTISSATGEGDGAGEEVRDVDSAAAAGDDGSGGQDDLLVNIPVAEIEGDFRCEVGHADNPGRPAVTRVHVLRRDMYHGRPVTKVLLTPHSGRRHQLRVHCRCLGHPIVGDATYGYPEAIASSLQHSETRMLLHAFKLEIRVSSQAMQALSRARYRELVRPEADTVLVRGEAPDPFEDVLGGRQ